MIHEFYLTDVENWARSDEIRDHFKSLGYTLEDTAEGTVWKKE